MSLSKTSLLLVTVLTFAACTQTAETRINESPMQSKRVTSEIILNSDDDLHEAADLWQRGGQSPVYIVATYAPDDEAIARHNADTAAARLRALGVSDVDVNLVPAQHTEVIAHMTALTAGAASACIETPGIGHIETAYDYQNYRLGCGVDKYMAMQVAKTRDLEGRVPGQRYNGSDGQRQGNIVDVYRTGKPNEPLEGLVSSDIAEGQ